VSPYTFEEIDHSEHSGHVPSAHTLLPEVQCLLQWTPQSAEKCHSAQTWLRPCTWSAGEDRTRTWRRLTVVVQGCKPQSCDQAKRLACTDSQRYTYKHTRTLHTCHQLTTAHAHTWGMSKWSVIAWVAMNSVQTRMRCFCIISLLFLKLFHARPGLQKTTSEDYISRLLHK